MTAPIVSGKNFEIDDATAAAEGVTGFNFHVGTASGQYATVAALSVADVAAELLAGKIVDALANLVPPVALIPGTTYFAVATAVNAAGESPMSPEFTFTVAKTPSAPTGFRVF